MSILSSIDIVNNLKEFDFLDVTFNLKNNNNYPNKKPNKNLAYITTSSNHPPMIIKQLIKTISERLSYSSPNIEVFNKAKPLGCIPSNLYHDETSC